MSEFTILITGANGFVGQAVARRLQKEPAIRVRKALRSAPADTDDTVGIGEIGPDTDWTKALTGVNAVIHCAARVHIMNDAGSAESLASFRKVNVEGTANLARQAAAAGVSRLVFVSSIKVNGETTTGLPPFSSASQPAPVDAYGISKWEAEQRLWDVAQETGLEVAVVRPPLVYGPGVKANFLRLLQAVGRGMPLPFGLVDNRRSMVYVENLVDLLVQCACDQRAASQTFLVSDGEDLSTKQLIEFIAKAKNLKPRLLPIPSFFMWMAARLIRKQGLADRVLGSLQVDIAYTCTTLDWKPIYAPAEGIRATAVTRTQGKVHF